MKIADYGKAITSYIESPTTAQKLQAKEKAQTLIDGVGTVRPLWTKNSKTMLVRLQYDHNSYNENKNGHAKKANQCRLLMDGLRHVQL